MTHNDGSPPHPQPSKIRFLVASNVWFCSVKTGFLCIAARCLLMLSSPSFSEGKANSPSEMKNLKQNIVMDKYSYNSYYWKKPQTLQQQQQKTTTTPPNFGIISAKATTAKNRGCFDFSHPQLKAATNGSIPIFSALFLSAYFYIKRYLLQS